MKKIFKMGSSDGKILIQVFYTLVLSQSVTMFPVIVKYERTGDINGPLANGKYSEPGALESEHTLLRKVHNRTTVPAENFFQPNVSDILNGLEQSANVTKGYVPVLKGRKGERQPPHSTASSQKKHLIVNLQISPKLQEQRRIVKGLAHVTGNGPDLQRENTQQSSDLTNLDFLKSSHKPAVNQDEPLTSSAAGLGELKLRNRNPDSVFTYETEDGGNIGGLEKAEALAANPQAAATPKRTSTMILIISSTVVVLLVTCVTVSIFQCCCRKKNTEDLQSPKEEAKNENENNVPLMRSRNSIHDTPTYRPLSINSTGDGLVEEPQPQLSVRDKIRAFESGPTDQDPKPSNPDPGKPVRKRPKSKAFEEFENQGIIIGIGKGKPSRPKSTVETETGSVTELSSVTEPGLYNEIMASMSSDYNSSMLSDKSDQVMVNGCQTSPDTEMSSSYLDDEEDFAAIERNTHILRSFKRAPPPKNRSRSKRSSRRRIPLKDATNLSSTTDDQTDNREKADDVRVNRSESMEKPTDTSVQRVWSDLGSPPIHSVESISDIRMTDAPTNGKSHVTTNGHTPPSINGHSHHREEQSRRKIDREDTPPKKSSSTNGHQDSNKAPKGMTMYENPCYESLDVIQANIQRPTTTESSGEPIRQPSDKTEPRPAPRSTDRRISPPKTESRESPARSEQKSHLPKSHPRISPESSQSPERHERRSEQRDERKSHYRREERISPPKNGSRESSVKSERRKSWKETPSSQTHPDSTKPMRQTNL